ncbi:hypothetical protein TrVFT333_004197 [Trichoderma virens FT-333]|nr:hypothetical protein TrVFT333_004197 [Trichoderma virens FT-333]
MASPKKKLPSERWKSFGGWDYGGMKERLEGFMASINKAALIEHASTMVGSPVSLSDPFSAGQSWCCFELVAPDHLLIARVRLPKHPDSNAPDAADEYLVQCEVATMEFLQANIKTGPIQIPKIYAYEAPGSAKAIEVGASYMLIQGFYGNSLQDVNDSLYDLPISTQEHIFAQWTAFQAELAVFTFPQIGSISQFSTDTGPVIGAIATSWLDHLPNSGPFQSGWEYFVAMAEGFVTCALQRKRSDTEGEYSRFAVLGPFIFRNIVRDTEIFKSIQGPFHLNHMDMGMQNILVDDEYNFVAIIDWEFAQSAPWEVNHYPMPIPLISSDRETAEFLHDTKHIAHRNTARQVGARLLYRQQFEEAERALERRGNPLRRSIADVLEGKASRICGVAGKIGIFDGMEEELTYELVRLGYGLTGSEAEEHVRMVEEEMQRTMDGVD